MKFFNHLIICGLLLPCIVSAKTISVVTGIWPPFITDNKDKPGISVEIVTAAMDTQGYKLNLKFVPWPRVLKMLKDNDADISISTWYSKDRSEHLRFSNKYLVNELVIIQRINDKFEYNGVRSLNGKVVGVVRGYDYGDEFNNSSNFEKSEVKNTLSNLRKLLKGRIDLTLGDKLVLLALINREGMGVNNFKISNQIISRNPLYVTSGKSNDMSSRYIEAFNKGLEMISSNGKLTEILSRYGVTSQSLSVER